MPKSNSHKQEPLILGISASHNGSACLIRGSAIIVAIQEERLTRVKRKVINASTASLAIQYCFNSAKVSAEDLDMIVVCVQGHAKGNSLENASLNPQLQTRRDDVPIIYAPHHLCHAISAYATSGFTSSDILVIDGVGSPKKDLLSAEQSLTPKGQDYWESLSCYTANGISIKPLTKHMRQFSETTVSNKSPTANNKPNSRTSVRVGSLGSMFEAVSLIIFGERLQAGKVMGLAAYGQPNIPVDEFLIWDEQKITFTNKFTARFKSDGIWPNNSQNFQDLACSVQQALEYATLKQVEHLRKQSNSVNLCYAGGVALNTLLNERIIRESGYEKIYIIPAAEDSGTAIGAAFYGLWQLREPHTSQQLKIDSVGHHYSSDELEQSLTRLPGIRYNMPKTPYELDSALNQVAKRLSNGEVGGWFQGGSELGPRALGQRSMLCDARSSTAKDTLNNRVKKRESFRPFAPIVLQEHAAEWFDFGDTDAISPFMLRVVDVLPFARKKIPAVVHEDGTARVQTVSVENGLIYPLLKAFYNNTGVPILLNTSLNVAGEPIVETPEDAWRCLQTTPLTFCMIEQSLVMKSNQRQTLLDFYPRSAIKQSSIKQFSNNNYIASISTNTPWGELATTLTIPALHLLKMMDGNANGWDLIQQLNQDKNDAINQENMIKTMHMLHQHYAIEFNHDLQ